MKQNSFESAEIRFSLEEFRIYTG